MFTSSGLPRLCDSGSIFHSFSWRQPYWPSLSSFIHCEQIVDIYFKMYTYIWNPKELLFLKWKRPFLETERSKNRGQKTSSRWVYIYIYIWCAFFCCIFIHVAYIYIYCFIIIYIFIYIDIRFCTYSSKHTYPARCLKISHDTWVSGSAKVTDALGSALAFVGLKNEVKEREDLGRETPVTKKKQTALMNCFFG